MDYKLGLCDEAMNTGECFEIDGEFYACGKVCSPSNMQKGKIYFADSIDIPDVSMIQTESDVTDDTAIMDKKLDPREDWDLEAMSKMQKTNPTSTEKTCAKAILDNDEKSVSVWRKLKESFSIQSFLNFESAQMEKIYCPTCKLDICQPKMKKMQETLPYFCQGCSSYLLQEDTASENALDSLVEALTGESGENIPEKGKIRVLDHMVKNTPFTFLCGSVQSSSTSFNMSHLHESQISMSSSEHKMDEGKYSKQKILADMPFPDSSDSSSHVALASHAVEIHENTENEMATTNAFKNKKLLHQINEIELTEEKSFEEQKQSGNDTVGQSLSMEQELQPSMTFDEENKILHNCERVHEIASSAILKVSSEKKHLSKFMCERCRMPMINVDESTPVCVTCPLIHREARRNALNKRFDEKESTDVGCLVEVVNSKDEESSANTSDTKESEEDFCPVSDDCDNFSNRFGFDQLPISYSDCEVLEKVHTIVLDTNENRNEQPKVQYVDWQPTYLPEDILSNVENLSSSSHNESFISSQRSQGKDLNKMMNLHESKTASNASPPYFTDEMFDTLSPSTNTVISLETSTNQHFQPSAYDPFGDKPNSLTVNDKMMEEEISTCGESQGGFSSICDRITASFDRVDDIHTSSKHYSRRIEKPRNHICDMNKTRTMDNLWLSNTSKIANEDAYIFSPRRRARTRLENEMEVYQSLSSKYGKSTEFCSKGKKKEEKSIWTESISNRSTKSTRTKPCPEAPIDLSSCSINAQRSLPRNIFDKKTEVTAHSPITTHPFPILKDERQKYEQNKSHDDTYDESENEHLLSLLTRFQTIATQISELDDLAAIQERSQKAANSHKNPVLQDLSNNKTVGKVVGADQKEHFSKRQDIDDVLLSDDAPIDSLLSSLETVVSAFKEVERKVQEEKVRIQAN